MDYPEIMDKDDQKKVLRAGLLGQYGQPTHMYSTSARFREKIDMLVSMLPAMVDGLMKESFEQDKSFELEVMKAQLATQMTHRIYPEEMTFEPPPNHT